MEYRWRLLLKRSESVAVGEVSTAASRSDPFRISGGGVSTHRWISSTVARCKKETYFQCIAALSACKTRRRFSQEIHRRHIALVFSANLSSRNAHCPSLRANVAAGLTAFPPSWERGMTGESRSPVIPENGSARGAPAITCCSPDTRAHRTHGYSSCKATNPAVELPYVLAISASAPSST